MGEVRDSRSRNQALVSSVRDIDDVTRHVESAGDLLIKELVEKQTNTKTSLEEQLNISQKFVSGLTDAGSSKTSQNGDERNLTIEELKRRTGFSRERLEELLSIKPNSTVSKLYKFALNNHVEPSAPTNLISLLPDHPLNRLKTIEEDLMEHVNKKKQTGIKKRKRKKHRTRKKKVTVEQSCDPSSLGSFRKESEEEEVESQVQILKEPEKEKVLEAGLSSEEEADHIKVGVKRRSLWDVKDMKTFCKAQPQKVYTIRDGKIISLNEKKYCDSVPSSSSSETL